MTDRFAIMSEHLDVDADGAVVTAIAMADLRGLVAAHTAVEEIRTAIAEFEKTPDKWGWSPVPLVDAIKEIVGYTPEADG